MCIDLDSFELSTASTVDAVDNFAAHQLNVQLVGQHFDHVQAMPLVMDLVRSGGHRFAAFQSLTFGRRYAAEF